MIRTCLFDMENVLVFFSHDRMVRQVANVSSLTEQAVRDAMIGSDLQFAFERGEMSADEFHRRFCTATEADVSFNDFSQAASDIFQTNHEMSGLLRSLKAAGIRLIVFSNTCVTHYEFIRANFEILSHFDDFVLSYEAGSLKPDAGMYEAALQKIDCDPDECFYTDDLAANIEAGQAYGLRGAIFTSVRETVIALRELGVPLP